jgi:uncharacterized protein YbaR (Trm112 family)
MSFDPQLLEILVCPEDKTPLTLAAPELLEQLNAAQQQGKLKTAGGETVASALTAGLLRQDGSRLYPIRDDIPVMLIEESIVVPA